MITFKFQPEWRNSYYEVLYDGYIIGRISYEDGEWLYFCDEHGTVYDAKMMRSIAAAIDAVAAHQQPKDDEE